MSASYDDLLSRYSLRRMTQLQRQLEDPNTLDREQVGAIFNLFEVVLDDRAIWPQTVAFLTRFAPIAERHAVRGHWDQWLEQAASRARQRGDSAAEAWMLYYLGMLYKDQGYLPKALEVLKQSADRFQLCGDQAGQAKTLALLAFTAQLAGRLEEAESAVETVRGLSLGHHERAMILAVRGILALHRRALRQAKGYFHASRAAYEMLSDERYLAFGLVNLGTVHRRLGEVAAGDECFQRAIELARRTGDPRTEATAALNRGNLYLRTEPRKALSCLEGVEWILIDVGDRVQLASLYSSRGMAWHALGDYAAAIESYEKALEYHEALHQAGRLINLLDNHALSLAAVGRYDAARASLRRADALLRQIPDQQQRAELRAMLERSGAALGDG